MPSCVFGRHCGVRHWRHQGLPVRDEGLPAPVKFLAKDIWPGADPTVSVTLKFDDLGTINWATIGECRNQSAWIDRANLDLSFFGSDRSPMNEAEQEESGFDKISVRFTVLQLAVDKVVLNLGAVPFSKEELTNKARENHVPLSSPSLATVAIKLFSKDGKMYNAIPVLFSPTEEPGDRVGFGHLPLIEAIGQGQVSLPNSDDLEEEMILFLQGQNPTNNA